MLLYFSLSRARNDWRDYGLFFVHKEDTIYGLKAGNKTHVSISSNSTYKYANLGAIFGT